MGAAFQGGARDHVERATGQPIGGWDPVLRRARVAPAQIDTVAGPAAADKTHELMRVETTKNEP
jgi:hypothetical protein